ncbi:MAG TPA: acylphosphatase [Virgibacillus sp.]|nr:acylphosphatase [Virgibacillus sp.]HLR66264.1 acylphosphatase [Virgibacillus sp.]
MNIHMVISGRVQGVGFRYATQQKAIEYGLDGWVQNNFEGTVELEIEGTEEKLYAFIDEMKSGFNPVIRIDHIEKQINEEAKGYKRFSIK